MKTRSSQMTTSAWQKIALVLLGLILSLVFLEAGLRLGGFVLSSMQGSENLRSIKQKGAYRILCLGESTTQEQYPRPLEQILNQRNIGVRFSVIDKGKGCTDTNFLLSQVESYLAEYRPDMVVAMMGINDMGVRYYQDIPESDTWLFKYCRVYRFGRMLFMHLLKKINREDIYGLSGSNSDRKAKPEDAEAVPEKANLSNGTSAEKITPIDSKNAGGTHGPAGSYLNGPKPSGAGEVLGKDVELGRKNDKGYVELGRLYQERGEFSQAEDFLGKAVLLDPENEKAYDELRKLYRLQGKVFRTEGFFKKAIELDPKNDKAYVGLGRFYMLLGNYSQGEGSLKKAIELNPKNDIAYVGLGYFFRERGELSQAEDSFKKAIEINPGSDKAFTGLGLLYREQGKLPQAEDSHRKAIERNPGNDGVYVLSGCSYFQQNKFSQAEDILKKAIELNPSSVHAFFELGGLYREQGKFSQAEDIFKKARVLNPSSVPAFFELVGFYRDQGKFSKAEDLFMKVIGMNSKRQSELIWRRMTSLYEGMGKPELKKEFMEKFRQVGFGDNAAVTLSNYRKLKGILDRKRIRLVCAQYPMRNVETLKKIFAHDKGVIFVDNESLFKKAVKKSGYKEYFLDAFAGDFGHCTQKGNELLAQNIADVILREVFNK